MKPKNEPTEKEEQVLKTLQEMEEVMRVRGYLPIIDAMKFLDLGFSISENYRFMKESRNKWRDKYEKLLIKYEELSK